MAYAYILCLDNKIADSFKVYGTYKEVKEKIKEFVSVYGRADVISITKYRADLKNREVTNIHKLNLTDTRYNK